MCSLIVAVLASVILLWQYPESTSVEALVAVTNQSKAMAFLYPEEQKSFAEQESFRKTQAELLESEFVLKSALARRDIAQLEAVRMHEPDPIAWLTDALEVSYPEGGQLLSVRYEGTQDAEEMKKIIDAVINAYQQEIIVARTVGVEERREGITKNHRDIGSEIAEKMDTYYALEKQLESERSIETDDVAVATGQELDRVNAQLQEFLAATDDAEDAAAIQLIASLREALEARPKPTWDHVMPSKAQSIRSSELAMLENEINQLTELNHEFAARVRKLDFLREHAEELFRVVQPAIANEAIDATQSYRIATGGGLLTFVVTCLGLLLCSSSKGGRIAALGGFAALAVAGLGLLLIVGFEW